MANDITPMVTNIAASGKVLNLTTGIEFDVGAHGVNGNRTPLIALAIEGMAYDQMIPFQVDTEAAQAGVNLWEAPVEALRARAVIIECVYGAGGIIINPDGNPIPFPLASDGTVSAWLLYANPVGTGLVVDVGGIPTNTGPGINKITVDTENEARFMGYVFI